MDNEFIAIHPCTTHQSPSDDRTEDNYRLLINLWCECCRLSSFSPLPDEYKRKYRIWELAENGQFSTGKGFEVKCICCGRLSDLRNGQSAAHEENCGMLHRSCQDNIPSNARCRRMLSAYARRDTDPSINDGCYQPLPAEQSTRESSCAFNYHSINEEENEDVTEQLIFEVNDEHQQGFPHDLEEEDSPDSNYGSDDDDVFEEVQQLTGDMEDDELQTIPEEDNESTSEEIDLPVSEAAFDPRYEVHKGTPEINATGRGQSIFVSHLDTIGENRQVELSERLHPGPEVRRRGSYRYRFASTGFRLKCYQSKNNGISSTPMSEQRFPFVENEQSRTQRSNENFNQTFDVIKFLGIFPVKSQSKPISRRRSCSDVDDHATVQRKTRRE